jgi:hypothetical protein
MSEPSFEIYKHEVLSTSTEDLTGVYEALWQANSFYPDRPLSERLAVAERAIHELLSEGLIELQVGTWKTASGDPPVSLEEAEKLLKEWSTWAIPDGPTVFFIATESGKQMYFAGK